MSCAVNEKQSDNISPVVEETTLLRGENRPKYKCPENILCPREIKLTTIVVRQVFVTIVGIITGAVVCCSIKDYSQISHYLVDGFAIGYLGALGYTIGELYCWAYCSSKKYSCLSEEGYQCC